jgi:hypothetical protein
MVISKLTFSHVRDMVRNFAGASGRQVSSAPRGMERTAGSPCPRQSAITRSAAPSRRCTAVSRWVNPATGADRARKAAGAAGRRAQREGGRDHRRRAPRDHPAQGGRHPAGLASLITRLRQSWEEKLQDRGPESCSLTSPSPSSPASGEARGSAPRSDAARLIRIAVRARCNIFSRTARRSSKSRASSGIK